METMEQIDTAQIAEILRLTRQHVTDKIIKRPDFPKPVVYVSRRTRYWSREDVIRWARRKA